MQKPGTLKGILKNRGMGIKIANVIQYKQQKKRKVMHMETKNIFILCIYMLMRSEPLGTEKKRQYKGCDGQLNVNTNSVWGPFVKSKFYPGVRKENLNKITTCHFYHSFY